MKTLSASTIILTFSMALSAQPAPANLLKVYVGSDGLAHIVDSVGKDSAIPKESDQVALESPKLAPNNQIAGWLIETDNCCTSYPIPTVLVLYQNGKKRFLGSGQMIYDWCFVGRGAQVAFSVGPTHNPPSRDLYLYDTRSGKQLQEWNGDFDAKPPAWAKDLNQ